MRCPPGTRNESYGRIVDSYFIRSCNVGPGVKASITSHTNTTSTNAVGTFADTLEKVLAQAFAVAGVDVHTHADGLWAVRLDFDIDIAAEGCAITQAPGAVEIGFGQ